MSLDKIAQGFQIAKDQTHKQRYDYILEHISQTIEALPRLWELVQDREFAELISVPYSRITDFNEEILCGIVRSYG